ncbi:MAG: hypothetical protein FD170_3393 [Bacteroidetes bacterium]|nr:MAG: hypothetical protein FD170_3393 [Bacteroidota bacterium]
MANRYWVGGSGNWNDSARWSETSGGAGGASVPTQADNVYFDANSFAANGTVTINAHANCLDMDWTGLDQSVTLSNAAFNLSIYGSLTLAAGLTWTFSGTGYLYFRAIDSRTITTNGIVLRANRIYYNGINGKWTLLDNFSTISTSTYYISGEFDTNDKVYTVGDLILLFAISVILTFRNSLINAGDGVIFGTGTIPDSAVKINFGTSTIRVTGNWFTGGGKTYYDIELIKGGASLIAGQVGAFSCRKLTRTSTIGANANLPVVHTINVEDLILTGFDSGLSRLLVHSTTIGTPRTIACNGTITASNVDFRDITLAGTANRDLSSILGGSGDCGGNSEIIFTPAQTQYFKHTSGACNWSDASKWFSNFDRTVAGRVPLPQDDAIFDLLSFIADSNLTFNCPRIGGVNFNDINVNLIIAKSIVLDIYRDFILSNRINVSSFYNNNYFLARYDFIYKAFNKNIPSVQYFNSPVNVSVIMNMNETFTGIGIYCTVNFNNHDITIAQGNRLYVYPLGTLILGNGTLSIITGSLGMTMATFLGNVIPQGSTIHFNNLAGSYQSSVDFNNRSFNIIKFSGLNTGGCLIEKGFSCNELIIDPSRKLSFTNGILCIISKLTAIGDASNPITIGSTTAANHTLQFTGEGIVNADYCSISYSNATPANRFFAGRNSINGGNNSGWVFARGIDASLQATAAAALAAMAQRRRNASLVAIAIAQLQVTALRKLFGQAAITATGNINLLAVKELFGSATLQGDATLLIEVIRQRYTTATLDGEAGMQLLASAIYQSTIQLTAAGLLNVSATSYIAALIEQLRLMSGITLSYSAPSIITLQLTLQSKIK